MTDSELEKLRNLLMRAGWIAKDDPEGKLDISLRLQRLKERLDDQVVVKVHCDVD